MSSLKNDTTDHQSKSRNQHHHQQSLVSAMIKQGFISDPFLSPPPNFRPGPNPINSPTRSQMMSVEVNHKPWQESHKKAHERISDVLSRAPFREWGMGDVRLTVAEEEKGGEREAFRVSMDVHRRVLASRSRFFAEKLRRSGTHCVEILECDDVEVYVEVVVMMYEEEVRGKMVGMEVKKILAILKVSSALLFDDGINSCLEHLEAIPWSESEEETVISHLNHLHLDASRTDDLLQRVTSEPSTSSRPDEIFSKLSNSLLQAKDEKSRKELKLLVSRLIKETKVSISRDTLYNLVDRCLSSLILSLSEATCLNENTRDRGALMGDISREADNMQWVLEILIDRKIGEEFVKLWADQKELAILHSKIPVMYRHEISKITAQICISIGKGNILVAKETRFRLLSTWLDALYDDFGWMKRVGRSVDKKLVEEGLSRTILTLPLGQQQSILIEWFDKFLDRGDDCPNIQRAFEIWWRRAFVKRYVVESRLELAVCDVTN